MTAPRRPAAAPANAQAGQGQPRQPSPPRTGGEGIRVRALAVCYYDDKRRRAGDVFTIAGRQEFSEKYMELVDPTTPERITTGQEVLRQEHDAIVGATVKTRASDTAPLGE